MVENHDVEEDNNVCCLGKVINVIIVKCSYIGDITNDNWYNNYEHLT